MRQSRIGKNASDSELLSEANALRTSGAEVVYLLTSPVNFVKLATNGQAQAYSPIYMGPGITNGINIVAEAGCPAIGPAKFFSPFPQLDVIDQLDPDYQKSYQKYNGGEGRRHRAGRVGPVTRSSAPCCRPRARTSAGRASSALSRAAGSSPPTCIRS